MNFRKLRRAQTELQTGNLNRRLISIGIIAFVFIGALGIRLWDLQVIHGEDFRRRSETNRIETKLVRGLRGKILDRDGRLLAGSLFLPGICATVAGSEKFPPHVRTARFRPA